MQEVTPVGQAFALAVSLSLWIAYGVICDVRCPHFHHKAFYVLRTTCVGEAVELPVDAIFGDLTFRLKNLQT